MPPLIGTPRLAGARSSLNLPPNQRWVSALLADDSFGARVWTRDGVLATDRYELLQTGVCLDDLHRVIRYLQREIQEGRRYVGALKLSNLLQPDRFEEDLHISRVRLHPQSRAPRLTAQDPPPPSPQLREQARQRALTLLRQFKSSLR